MNATRDGRVRQLEPGPDETAVLAPRVHPTAAIEEGVDLGPGTTVWHQSQVRSGAALGASCVIGKNVFVDSGVIIGNRVKIQNNVSVYRGVRLEDDVLVGPSAVFTNDLLPRAVSPGWQVVPTHVRRGASIGANSTIVCGIEVGEYAMVGAGAVVTRSVEPHQLVTGNPARHHGWVCECGTVVSRGQEPPSDLTCASCPARTVSGASGRSDERACSRVRLGAPALGAEEEDAVLDVLRSGQLTSGPWVARFEREFAQVHESGQAVAVSNGTTALVAALRAHGIGQGDEVITAPLTFVATLNAILEVGALARFADIGEDFLMDPDALAAAITPRTRAVIPVHLYGQPADMPGICELAKANSLAVIADAAQAHGAGIAGRAVGAFGTATFSLYGAKNITCGEGGVVTTSDKQVAARLRLLRNHGMRDRYEYVLPGSNYRLTEMQAALATVQLSKLDGFNQRRSENAARLTAGLSGLPGLILPSQVDGRRHAWHQYTVRVLPTALLDRSGLAGRLDGAGIDSRAFYPKLVHDYPCFARHPRVEPGDTPVAAKAVRQVLSLPVHPGLSATDIDRVIQAVRGALTGH